MNMQWCLTSEGSERCKSRPQRGYLYLKTKMRLPGHPRHVDEWRSSRVCFENHNYFGKSLGTALPTQTFTHSPTWCFCLWTVQFRARHGTSFLFPFFFWDTYNLNVGVFNIITEVSETILNSFHSFFFILLFSNYFQYSAFQLIYLFFCLVLCYWFLLECF